MKNCIKIELDRAIRCRGMFIALLAGCSISIMQIIVDVIPLLKNQETEVFTMFPFTVFEKYIGLIPGSMFPTYFYIFIPIIAAIPYALTTYSDRKTGYIKNVFTRTKRVNYYTSKYISAFISAGIVVVVPQILNLLIVALLLPSITPYPGIGYVGIFDNAMWSNIYYSNPYVYIFMYWALDFVFYGLLNTLAISMSWLFHNRFGIMLIPFIAFQFLEFGMQIIGKYAWMPESFLRPSQPMPGTSKTEIVILIVIMLILCVFSEIYGVKKKDYYN